MTSVFRGASILYFVDSVHGTDSAAAALDDIGNEYGVSVNKTEVANFVADLESLEPSMVVYLVQSYPDLQDDVLTALLDWIEAGNPLVFATWDASHADSLTMAAALEASFAGNLNFKLMLVEDERIASGLSSTTVPITNAGWGTYSLGLAAENDGVELAHWYDDTPELTTEAALVSGNDGRTMMVGFFNDVVTVADGAALYTNIFEYVLLASTP